MKHPLFSIIIPMYNVESYIERCIGSVFNQVNHGLSSFEVLLINDGSTDNTEEAARKCCTDLKNVKIITQKNKGLGGARNTGIINSTGKYLVFLDADDVLVDDFFQICNAKKFNEDIIEFGFNRVSKSFFKVYTFPNTVAMPGIDYILNKVSINSACNKFYKRDFLVKDELFFKERIYGEDIEFNIRAFLKAKKVKSCNLVLFTFNLSANSITRNADTQRKLKYVNDVVRTIISTKELMTVAKGKEINYLKYRLTALNTNNLVFILKNRLPKHKVIKQLKTLNMNQAFVLSYKLKERNLLRIILNNRINRKILFLLILRK